MIPGCGDAQSLLDSHGAGLSELRGGVGIGSQVEWVGSILAFGGVQRARAVARGSENEAQPSRGSINSTRISKRDFADVR